MTRTSVAKPPTTEAVTADAALEDAPAATIAGFGVVLEVRGPIILAGRADAKRAPMASCPTAVSIARRQAAASHAAVAV